MAAITTKTGTMSSADSSARVVLELCGSGGGCCQTSKDGRGLDNPGEDRRKSQTDVYTATSILSNCAEQVVWSNVGNFLLVKLSTGGPVGKSGHGQVDHQ